MLRSGRREIIEKNITSSTFGKRIGHMRNVSSDEICNKVVFLLLLNNKFFFFVNLKIMQITEIYVFTKLSLGSILSYEYMFLLFHIHTHC